MTSASLLPMTLARSLDSDDSEDQYSFTSFGSMEGLHPEDLESPDRSGSPTSSLLQCNCHDEDYCPNAVIETVELALVVRPKHIGTPACRRPLPLPVDDSDDSAHASDCDSDVMPAITLTKNPLNEDRATTPLVANEAESKHRRKDSVTPREVLASEPPANVTVNSPPASAFSSPTPPKSRRFKRLFKRKKKNPSTSSDPLTTIEPFPDTSRPMTPIEQQFPVSYSNDLAPEPVTTLPGQKPPELTDRQQPETPSSKYVYGATANRHLGPSNPSFDSPSPAAQRHQNEARWRLADQHVKSHQRNLSATINTPASATSHFYKYVDSIGFSSRNANTGIAATAAPGVMAAAEGTPTPTHLRRKKSLKQLVKRSGSDSLPISRPMLMANNSMTPMYYQKPVGERDRAEGGDLRPSDQQRQHQHDPAPVHIANNTSPRDHPMNHMNNYTFTSAPSRAGVSGGAVTDNISPASCNSPAGSPNSSPWPSRKSSLAPPPLQTVSPKPQQPQVCSHGESSPSRSLRSTTSERSEKSERRTRSIRSQGSIWDVVNLVDALEEKVREDEECSYGDGDDNENQNHNLPVRNQYDSVFDSDEDEEEEPSDAEKLALHAGVGGRLETELDLQQVKQGKPQVVEVDADVAKDSSDGTTLVEGSDSFDCYSSSEYEDD